METLHVVLDSGAEANLISPKEVKRHKLPISKSSQKLVQADGDSSLEVIGKIHAIFKKGDHYL